MNYRYVIKFGRNQLHLLCTKRLSWLRLILSLHSSTMTTTIIAAHQSRQYSCTGHVHKFFTVSCKVEFSSWRWKINFHLLTRHRQWEFLQAFVTRIFLFIIHVPTYIVFINYSFIFSLPQGVPSGNIYNEDVNTCIIHLRKCIDIYIVHINKCESKAELEPLE